MIAQYDDEGIERPVLYSSRELAKAENKYAITDKEGLAATWGVRKHRHLLAGSHVIMIVDHSSLKALVTKQYLTSARQIRYAMDLCEVCPEILHRAGSQLWIPDMLSRLGYPTDKAKVEDGKPMSSADKAKM